MSSRMRSTLGRPQTDSVSSAGSVLGRLMENAHPSPAAVSVSGGLTPLAWTSRMTGASSGKRSLIPTAESM